MVLLQEDPDLQNELGICMEIVNTMRDQDMCDVNEISLFLLYLARGRGLEQPFEVGYQWFMKKLELTDG